MTVAGDERHFQLAGTVRRVSGRTVLRLKLFPFFGGGNDSLSLKGELRGRRITGTFAGTLDGQRVRGRFSAKKA